LARAIEIAEQHAISVYAAADDETRINWSSEPGREIAQQAS
jgi:hypothetical protein